jgi:hypothetical protein
MSSRYLGVVSLERYLVAERYWESYQAFSSHPRRSLAADRAGGRDGEPQSSGGTGAPARARHR